MARGPAGIAHGSPGLLSRIRGRLDGWTPELRQTARTLVSVFLSDIVARGIHLREPYWALITAIIVTQARISSTLDAGRDQILGTLIGAAAGAAAIALALMGLPRLPVFAALMVPLALLAAFKPNLRLAGVTLVVVFLFPAQGGAFDRPVDRALAILVGAGVSLLVSYLLFRQRARGQAFQAASSMLDTLDDTQRRVLRSHVDATELERLNDISTEALKALVAAIAEARRERLGSIERHEPLMVRLAPTLRRLQSDVLFLARAIEQSRPPGSAGSAAPPAPAAELGEISDAIAAAIEALRVVFDDEAQSRRPSSELALQEAGRLTAVLERFGERAGPLPRFTLQMLGRDLSDAAVTLQPANNDRA